MVRKFLIYFVILLFTWPSLASSQSRLVWSINDNWKFLPGGIDFAQRLKFNDSNWETVNIPHTWNAKDPFDVDKTSRRGLSWYRKELKLDSRFIGKRVFLNFEGAGQIADVYVNGVFAGQHKGGYTGFTFDITDLIKLGDKPVDNLIAVQVNNAQSDFLPPLSIGYASYGGIYRDAWLISTDPLHFDLSDHGSKGIFISTPNVSAIKADVAIKTNVTNDGNLPKKFELVHTIFNQDNLEITSVSKTVNLAANQKSTIELNINNIIRPNLWSPENPYLYHVKTQILANGKVVDELTNPLGFRWFSFDPNTGFSLNGSKYILKGTNRHQDFKDKGDALSSDDHYRDMKLIKDMGCNFLRLAHYPQAPEVLALADKMGLLIWEEIPLVNYMNPVPEFLDNSKYMIKEMIRQNYNHPSVIIWGSMNEVLLWSDKAARIQVQDNKIYLAKVRNYAQKLDSLVRAEDPSRKSTMAMHMSDDYDKYKLSEIPGLASYNIYNGWYSGKFEEFKPTIDGKHSANPKQVLFISEYGAEADNRINTERPVRFDFTGQYQRAFHESYLSQIKQMPYLAGTAVWNEFDFSQPNVGGVSNNMNLKGLITWDRKPKDSYYMYKANWNPNPMIYIASRDWKSRAGLKNQTSTIEVYSNLDEVELFVNGKSYGIKKPNDIKKCVWTVQLLAGPNNVATIGKNQVEDHLTINYSVYSENLKEDNSFRELAVNVGADAQYIDGSEHIWVEDRPYKIGSFGHIGGTPSMLNIKTVKKNTADNPLFYSFLDNLRGYKFDVRDGNYELELCFIEGDKIEKQERVFSVAVNGDELLNNMDLTKDFGFAVAVKKKFLVNVQNGKGINIAFEAKIGNPVLSGIKLKLIN